MALCVAVLPPCLAGETKSPASSAQQAAANSKNVEREQAAVAKLEDEWLAALTTPDVDAIAGILGDDFVRPAPDYGNFVDKRGLLAFYRSHLHHEGSRKKHIEDMKITIYGSTALARGTVVTTDAAGAVVSKLLFTDVFVQRNGRWQAVSAQENAVVTPAPAKH
jgi:hypothetical protein